MRSPFQPAGRSIAILLALAFAVQLASFGAQHAFHGVKSVASAADSHEDEGSGNLPHEKRCDLCLSFRAADTGSVVSPPNFALHETAFAVVAAYSSFFYSRPLFFSRARGPPSRA